MTRTFYERVVNYWWPANPIPDKLAQEQADSPRPPSTLGRFIVFVQQRYPDLSSTELQRVRVRFYKVHQQLTVDRQYRNRRFNWDFLAAKLLDKSYHGPDLDKNEELWCQLQRTLKFD